MQILRSIPFLLLFLFFSTCRSGSSALSRLPSLGESEVYVSEEIFLLKDLIPVTNKKDIYNKNLFVGDLNFSGGISREKTIWGEQVVTKQIEFLNEPGVKEESVNYVQSIVTNKFKAYQKFTIFQPTKLFQVQFQRDLTKVNDEGADNINIPIEIPRFKISSSADFKAKKGVLLIPIIQYAYSHNAGWFNGQDWGCMAGVRAKLLLVWVQMDTKTVLHVEGLESKQKEPQNNRYNYLDRTRFFQKIWKEIEIQI
ncbi:hypothetical protein [Leptospira levettii]|uniref:Lipoprotein n=1 Tax=Leptospira levettii TaxID=2023178 RepID=A0AAW5V6V4_9LEPT|nr:hypothetical protein [Leptospira levettii]MCW7464797.1 hypothetical protein [Leptospira levettii]MCW7511019.1 hypothetical protein [Leptospira levettii]MCW7514773.1 hypothetical protein [Leptospira levettii]